MDDDVAQLQGKLAEVTCTLENFIPSQRNASVLKRELQTLLTILESVNRKMAYPAGKAGR